MLLTYWQDFAISVFIATAFFTTLGYAVSTRALRSCPEFVRWLISPLLGFGVWAGISVAGFHYLSFSRGTVTLAAGCALIAAIALAWRTRIRSLLSAAPLMVLAATLAFLPVVVIKPYVRKNALFFAEPIFDHMKVALVDAIYRHGLPPVSPFYAIDGQPVALNYYYGWHAVAAMLRSIPGVSGLAAEAALTYFTAFTSLLLLAGVAVLVTNRKIAGYIAVLCALPLGLEPALVWMLGDPYSKLISRDHGFESWLIQATWCPQHLFAGAIVVLASLLAVRLIQIPTGRWHIAVVLGLNLASAVISSVWAGVCALLGASMFVLLAIAATREARERISRWFWPMLAAIAVGVVTSLPVALNLVRLNREVALSSVELSIYPTIEGLNTFSNWASIKHIFVYWTIFLTIQFGAVYLAGWCGLLARGRQLPSIRLFRRLSIAVVFGDLLVAEFFRSVIINNDLGWRVVLPPVLLLIIWTAVAITDWLETLRRSRFGQLPRAAMAGISIVIFLGTWGLGYSVRFVGEAVKHREGDSASTRLGQYFMKQPLAWKRVRELTSAQDIVAVNPKSFEYITTWTANAPFSLFGDRCTLVSDSSTPLVFSHQASRDRFTSDLKFLIHFFNNTPSQREISRLAVDFQARALLVTPLDTLWNNGALDGNQYYALAVDAPEYRVYIEKRTEDATEQYGSRARVDKHLPP
jgi:hypothetical protein